MTLISLKPVEVSERLKAQRAVLVDIREQDEFAREHVAGAVHAPLSRDESKPMNLKPGLEIIYTCRTGNRTSMNAQKLADRVVGQAFVLEGGLEAWKAQGLPTKTDTSQPIEIMRQVQMAAGGLVLVGVGLGLLVHPAFWSVSAFVGAGLFFAGATGFCGMARLLAIMPWNRNALGKA